jgi:hypothetical protein
MTLAIILPALDAFAIANNAAASAISTAGSADSATMLAAAAGALGPIGATYLAAYAPAQENNLTGTLLVSKAHAAIGGTTEASRASFVATDGA